MITSVLVIVLGFLAWQDFKDREISWWLIPLITLGGIWKGLLLNDSHSLWVSSGINFLFCMLQVIITTLYFTIKNGRFTNIIDTMLGLGDILMLCCLCLYFSPVNFILFILFSMVISLVVGLYLKQKNKSIPLAGIQSILLILCFALEYTFRISLYNDVYIIAIIETFLYN